MQPINSDKDFTNSYKACKTLARKFNESHQTDHFDYKENLDTYLCALAYGSIGMEVFDESPVRNTISAAELKDEKFAEGMLKFSILSKINKAKGILNSTEFQKTGKINFSLEKASHDFATIHFVTYYLRSQGYIVNINPNQSEHLHPLNLDPQGNLSFKKGRQISHNRVLKEVAETLKTTQTRTL